VPTFQRRDSLARLLDALAAQTHAKNDFEVLVVDDGSTDGTREWLTAARMPYALRPLAQAHAGPGGARNLGVAEARGSLVVFFDDDVVPDPDAIARHVDAHRAQGETVVIGPMLPPTSWRRPPWIRWEEAKLLEQYRALTAGEYECTPRQLFTANASIERRQFLDAGGFDPAYARAEDVELGYRLRDLGSRFAFEPRARVTHYPRRTFASWQRTPYQYGRGDVAMHRDKGHQALGLAFFEFRTRHPLNRALARLCAGRPVPFALVTTGLRAAVRVADVVGAAPVADGALSVLFNLLYWQGVTDELGSRKAVWQSLDASVRAA
jgi:GT2 family glycosyltransferase